MNVPRFEYRIQIQVDLPFGKELYNLVVNQPPHDRFSLLFTTRSAGTVFTDLESATRTLNEFVDSEFYDSLGRGKVGISTEPPITRHKRRG